MKLKIICLVLFFNVLKAQTYEKDWDVLYKKIEAGNEITIKETEGFIARYKSQLTKYPDNSTQLYSLLANGYFDKGQYDKAKENYLESYKYAQQASDTSLKHIVELSLAVLSYTTDELLEAEKYYLKCMAGVSAIYDQSSREYTQIFFDYTRLLIDLGKYKDTSPYVDALLYYYKTLDGVNTTRHIALLNCQAIILQNTGNYPQAIEILSGIVKDENLLKLGDTLGHIITISNLADVCRESGSYDPAISHLKKAKGLFYQFRLKNMETVATIENNLALCYKSTGELKLAEEAYNNTLEIYRQLNQTKTEPYCSTLSNKADLLRLLGRYGEASELLLTALEIRRERFGAVTENYANAVSNLANVYFDAGFYNEALERHLEAKTIFEQTVGEEHQGYGNCLNSLSLCYVYFENYPKAEEYKLKALSIIEKSIGKDNYRYPAYLLSTYGLYLKTNQLNKAEKNIREALTLVERNFGRTHELFARGLLALAEIYTRQQKFEEAGPLYFECLDYYSMQINGYFDAMSEENQMDFLQFITPVFESYNIYLINYKLNFMGKEIPEHLRRALKYQLQLKSLLANRSSQVRREVTGSNDESLKKIYQDWVRLKTELINNFKSAESASQDHNDLLKRTSLLESQLKSSIKGFAAEKGISFEVLKEKLGTNEAAIDIFKVNEMLNDTVSVVRYGALIIKKSSKEPELILIADGDRLDGHCFSNYSRCIEEQKTDTLSYSAFFKPFEKALQGINRIYISSDGVYHKINLLSLYHPGTKKYLADDHEFYQTSNLSFISANRAQLNGTDLTATLFGYPDYDYDFKINQVKVNPKATEAVAKRFGLVNLPKLPGTKTEVEEISKELKGKNWKTDVYTDQFASEENLRKISSPKILHIATHGFYLKDVESEDKLFLGFESSRIKNNSLLRSGIILAGAGPATQDSTNRNSENDGILTAYEASLLDLNNTDLVVLSACQTGLGDEMGTEGVAGLQRSLTIAGAKNIIMSLWPVDDYATQFLMTEFYKNYSKNQDVETSFKLAQAEVKKKYPQPVFWAAFVLLKTFN